VEKEDDDQVAALTENTHQAPSEYRSPECGWKDGDRGGLAEWEQTHRNKKLNVCLDINRPSYGRTYAAVNLGPTRISLLFPCIPQQKISKSEIINKMGASL
jgi:hypothetical protein